MVDSAGRKLVVCDNGTGFVKVNIQFFFISGLFFANLAL